MRLWLVILLLIATSLASFGSTVFESVGADATEAPCDADVDSDEFDDDWVPEATAQLLVRSWNAERESDSLKHKHLAATVIDRPPCTLAG